MRKHEMNYLLREGVRGVFLHPFISFAAVTIIAACLVVMGSFTLLAHNIDTFIVDLTQRDAIVAFIENDVSDDDARAIYQEIGELGNIREIELITRYDRLDEFGEENPETVRFLRPGDNPFPHRVVFSVLDFEVQELTISEIENINGVDSVADTAAIRENLGMLRNVANIISWALIILLSLVSILIVSNTVKLATYERREEIAIMRVVGATKRFIRFPFFIEGSLLGLGAGLIAYGLQSIIYNAVTGDVVEFDFLDFNVVPFSDVNTMVLGAFLLGGLVTGSLGSVLTIRRFLKK